MRIDSHFTVGIHTLLVIGFFKEDKITSGMVARSIGCNPVIVRNVFLKLSAAGLLCPGKGNARTVLGRPPEDITLRDIFEATQDGDPETVFSMYPVNERCPVGSEVHDILHSRFDSALNAMMEDMSRTTLADLISELPADKAKLPEALLAARCRRTLFHSGVGYYHHVR